MIVKSSLLLLGAALAFANQTPLGDSSVCLSSATPNDCCTSGAPTGEVAIDGRTFKITCASALLSLNSQKAQKVSNARECVSLCADDVSCEASSFKAHGKAPRGNNCFFVLGENLDQKSDGEWITFTEIFPSCLESDDRNACCSVPEKQEDEVLIDNARWKWTCKSILTSLNRNSRPAANALECASLCASEGCEAISFRTLGDHKSGNCFFVLGSNKDQQQAPKFLTLVKVEDDNIDPLDPEPDCGKCVEEKEQCVKDKDQCIQDNKECNNTKDTCKDDLQQAQNKLETCQKNQVDPAKLAQCEADKLTSQKAEEDCRRHSGEVEEKRKQCRAGQQKCEEDKGDLSIQKQQCENDKNRLNLVLTKKDDEITALNSQITSLNGKLDALQQSYNALNVDCNGEGPGGKCRTNLFDAEPRDDQCIIAAGNEKFKIHYAKLDDPGPADLGTGRANSFKDCAERCANYKGTKKCVRFMWKTDGNDRACYMRSTGQGTVPTKSSPFSSGQLL